MLRLVQHNDCLANTLSSSTTHRAQFESLASRRSRRLVRIVEAVFRMSCSKHWRTPRNVVAKLVITSANGYDESEDL
jgi:hypothetical protein